MIITLSPLASNKTNLISINGDVITIDGTDFDLSSIVEGAQVKAEYPAVGIIKREGGKLHVTLRYHYESKLALPDQPYSDEKYIIDIVEGDIPCPIVWR